MELLEANAVSFFVNSVREASVYGFFKLFDPGISCGKLVDQIIEKSNEDQSSVNLFATYLSHQLWSIIKGKAVQNKDKETMFNKFYKFSIDEDVMSECVIVDQSSIVLQMTAQFILDKFLQFSLKLRMNYCCQLLKMK